MISSILKERTKQQHDDTESLLQSKKIFDKSYTLDDYKKLLIHNYNLISRFEPKIQEKLKHHPELKLEVRAKIDALETDLKNLDINIDCSHTIDNLANEAEAFGALYVMEGSTLGGNVIVKQLRRNSDFENIEFSYFGIYGENTGKLWQEFKTIMDDKIMPEEYEDCINGAQKAYQLLT